MSTATLEQPHKASHPKHEAPPQPSPAEQMIGILAGFWISRSVYVAAKLGVADLLASGPKTVEQLAIETGSHAPSLYRLLRGLASHGIFAEEAPHLFVNTPTSETLCTGVEGSFRYPLMMTMGGEHYDAWGNLLHAVKTGETAFDAKFGEGVWSFFEKHPENARIFDQAMTDFTRSVEPAVLRAYDFSAFKHVIDIGGGHGALLSAILKKHPHVRGTVFDQPYVAAQALKALSATKLTVRCNAVGGDFFEAVPPGGDCYTMKFILHDWDEQKSARILLNIRKAIAKTGKLLVIDTVVQEGNAPDFSKLMDLNMLAMTGGRERTAKEFATLLKAGGFQVTKVIKTESYFGIVEAVPV